MRNTHIYKWIIRAVIALCFALQSYSLSHATSFGDAPHNHDGIECELTGVTSAEEVNLPTPYFEGAPEIIFTAEPFYPIYQKTFSVFLSRAPPPRGPPTQF